MKRAAGFTLIELVIVIVILGILGAVAAPRFINLQDDAYAANINSLKGSIQSAATLANTKAVLGGWDKTASVDDKKVDEVTVQFAYGFPKANADGIIKMLQNDSAFTASGETDYNFDTIVAGQGEPAATATTIVIYPKGRAAQKTTCNVTYTQATDDSPVKIEAKTDGC